MGKVVPLYPSGGGFDVESGGKGRGSAGPYHPGPPGCELQETWVAWLIPTIAAANVLTFAYSLYVNDCPSNLGRAAAVSAPEEINGGCVFPSQLGRFAFEPLSVNPLFGPSTQTLDSLGALDYKKVVVDGEVWRLFTCVWLHAGVIHLTANMFSLLFVGIRLEQEFGFVKIGTLYALSGFGGSLLSCLSIQSNISVGASGALFGFLGAMLSELMTNWTIYVNKFAALMILVVIIALNMAVGAVPHVDNSAHIGGFISGFLLGFVLLIRPQFGWINPKDIPPSYNMDLAKPKYKLYQYLFWIVAFVLLVIWFMGGLIKLFNGVRIRS